MTNRKHTKRALVLSALSLLLCVSMLVGSTMAWFTDTATTGVNKIESGVIDIKLVSPIDGKDLEKESLRWMVKKGETVEPVDSVLWEPGATFYTEPIRVMNHSNLSFYLEPLINGIVGDTKLLEAIEFKIVYASSIVEGYTWNQLNGRGHLIAGTGTAFGGEGKTGNNWFAEDYGKQSDRTDEDETLSGYLGYPIDPSTLTPGTAKPLFDICVIGHMKKEAGNEYQGLTMEGIGLTFRATQAPHEYDSYDYLYDKDAAFPVVGAEELEGALADPTVKDVVIGGGTYTETVDIPTGKTVTSDNGTFTPADKYAVAVDVASGADLVLNGGTYMSSGQQIINSQSPDSTVTINGGTYDGSCLVWNGGSSEVVINDGTFKLWCLTVIDSDNLSCNLTVNGGNFTFTNSDGFTAGSGAPLVINGGTFNQDPTAYLGAGHTASQNSDGTWTVA